MELLMSYDGAELLSAISQSDDFKRLATNRKFWYQWLDKHDFHEAYNMRKQIKGMACFMELVKLLYPLKHYSIYGYDNLRKYMDSLRFRLALNNDQFNKYKIHGVEKSQLEQCIYTPTDTPPGPFMISIQDWKLKIVCETTKMMSITRHGRSVLDTMFRIEPDPAKWQGSMSNFNPNKYYGCGCCRGH